MLRRFDSLQILTNEYKSEHLIKLQVIKLKQTVFFIFIIYLSRYYNTSRDNNNEQSKAILKARKFVSEKKLKFTVIIFTILGNILSL